MTKLRQWAKSLRGEALRKVLFLPDTHCPYHDRKAYDLVERVAQRVGFDVIVIGGDFADFWNVSSHTKIQPKKETFLEEIDECKALLRRVESWGAKDRYYIEGNHENRLDRYIAERARELYNCVNTDELLEITDHGWKLTPYKDHTTIGKIWATHDIGKSGINAVRDALTSYQDNIVINHTHRMEYRIEGNVKGVPHVGASFGWLGDVRKVEYMYKVRANRDWALGFGIGYLRDNGFIYLQPVPIVQYSCVVEGQLFEV